MFVVDESKIVNGAYKDVMQVFSYDNVNEIELPWSGQFLVLLKNQYGALPIVDYFEGNRYKLNEAIYHYRGSNVMEFVKVGEVRKTMVLVPLSVKTSAYNMKNNGIKGAYIPELEKEIQKVLEVIRGSGANVTNKEKAFLNNLKFIEKELHNKTNDVFGKVEKVLSEVSLVDDETERFLSFVGENKLNVESKYNAFDTSVTTANQTIDEILALQPQFQSVLDETTGKDVISAPEIILARNGKPNLKTRIDDLENETNAQLAHKAEQDALEVEKQRINTLINLPEGSTTNDARLEDITIGASGEVYDSPGNAVRGQVYNLESELFNPKTYGLSHLETITNRYVRENNTIGSSSTRNLSYIKCEAETVYEVETTVVDSMFSMSLATTRPKSDSNVYDTVRNENGNKLRLKTDADAAWLVIVYASSDTDVTVIAKQRNTDVKSLEYSERTVRKGIDIYTSMLQEGSYKFKANDFTNKYVFPDANGEFINSETRISTQFLRMYKHDFINVNLGTEANIMFVAVLDDNLKHIQTLEKTDNGTLIPFTGMNKGYVVISFGHGYDGEISVDNYDATVSINRAINVGLKAEVVTVHFEKGKYDDTEDRYGGPVSNWKTHTINKYPIVLYESAISIQLPIIDFSTEENGIVIFRDSDGATLTNSTFKCGSASAPIDVPDGAYYIDIEIANDGLNDIDVRILYAYKKKPKEEKRIYVNSNNPTVNYIEVDREKDLYTGMAYMLPTNYTNTGKKVPLVIWFDGNASYNKMGRRFSEYKTHGLTYLRDEGYAVMQVFSWGSYYADKYPDCGLDQPYPVPTALNCIKKGIEYMTDRFNVDENDVHISSKSMGGLISLYFASRPIYDFKSIGMFSPILDMFGLRGRYPDARRAIFEDMDFSGDMSEFADISFDGSTSDGVENYYFSDRCINNTWSQNKTKLLRLNSAWTDLIGSDFDTNFNTSISNSRQWYDDKFREDIYTNTGYGKLAKIPVKIWAAKDDGDVPYQSMIETVAQMQNTGTHAEISIVDVGGHSVFDVDNTYAQSVTTKLGVYYEKVPLGWVELVKWVRQNSVKPIN